MNDVKTTFYKTLNTIVATNRVDNQEAYIINDYIGRLEATIKDEQQEIERLNKEKSILEKSLKLMWRKDIKIDYEELDNANKVAEEILRGEYDEFIVPTKQSKEIAEEISKMIKEMNKR